MSVPNDPMAAVRRYVDAFNNGDVDAMAALCADPMQSLDGMAPHVWQGATATQDWWCDVLAEESTSGRRTTASPSMSHDTSTSPADPPTSWFRRR